VAAGDSVANDTATKEIVIERVYDAPRERVFEVFTQPEHLRKWWGPKGIDITVSEFDAQPGGKFFFGERGPDGATVYNTGVVREIERPSRLVFALHFADADRNRAAPPPFSGLPANWDDDIVTSVTFTAEGQRTRLTIRVQSGFTAAWGEGARVGWAEALDKLGEAIAEDMAVAARPRVDL
jgi:uncharacterized protein YndB with AHSA1/START domain